MRRTRFTEKKDKEVPIIWKPIALSVPIMRLLFEQPSAYYLKKLYQFYLDACNHQKTNQVYVTDKLVSKLPVIVTSSAVTVIV